MVDLDKEQVVANLVCESWSKVGQMESIDQIKLSKVQLSILSDGQESILQQTYFDGAQWVTLPVVEAMRQVASFSVLNPESQWPSEGKGKFTLFVGHRDGSV